MRAQDKLSHYVFSTFWWGFTFRCFLVGRKKHFRIHWQLCFEYPFACVVQIRQHSILYQSSLSQSRMLLRARWVLTLFFRWLLMYLHVHSRLLDVKLGWGGGIADLSLIAYLLYFFWTCGGSFSLESDVLRLQALDLKTAAESRLTQDTNTWRLHKQLQCESRFCYWKGQK